MDTVADFSSFTVALPHAATPTHEAALRERFPGINVHRTTGSKLSVQCEKVCPRVLEIHHWAADLLDASGLPH